MFSTILPRDRWRRQDCGVFQFTKKNSNERCRKLQKQILSRASVVHFDHDARLFAQVPMAQEVRSDEGQAERGEDADEESNGVHGCRRIAVRGQRRRCDEDVSQPLKGNVAAHW